VQSTERGTSVAQTNVPSTYSWKRPGAPLPDAKGWDQPTGRVSEAMVSPPCAGVTGEGYMPSWCSAIGKPASFQAVIPPSRFATSS